MKTVLVPPTEKKIHTSDCLECGRTIFKSGLCFVCLQNAKFRSYIQEANRKIEEVN